MNKQKNYSHQFNQLTEEQLFREIFFNYVLNAST